MPWIVLLFYWAYIRQQLADSEINALVQAQKKLLIAKDDQSQFVKTILQDLEDISYATIVGTGITRPQLQKWLQRRKR